MLTGSLDLCQWLSTVSNLGIISNTRVIDGILEKIKRLKYVKNNFLEVPLLLNNNFVGLSGSLPLSGSTVKNPTVRRSHRRLGIILDGEIFIFF